MDSRFEKRVGNLSPSVLVNGRSTAVSIEETVGDLIGRLGLDMKGIAVAHNAEVLPRSKWTSTVLHQDDVLEVLSPLAGG